MVSDHADFAFFPVYKRKLAKLVCELVADGKYRRQIATIAKLVNTGKTHETIGALLELDGSLEDFFKVIRKLMLDQLDSEEQTLVAYLNFRKTVYESLKNTAIEHGEEEAATKFEVELSRVDAFFNESILDLDPDKKRRR